MSAFSALVPVFLLIALGHGLRRSGFLSGDFWSAGERLTYYLLFPALLVRNGAAAPLTDLPLLSLGVVATAPIVAAAATLTLVQSWRTRLAGPAYGALFQAAIRPNSYIALAASSALYGQRGLTAVSFCLLLVIPLVNALSVAALLEWGEPVQGRPRHPLGAILGNPLILASLGGFVLNWLALPLPGFLDELLSILGKAALPLALLAVGAGLDLRGTVRAGLPVAGSTLGKLLMLPVLAALLAYWLKLDGALAVVAILYAGMPCSASAYILARQLGGDAPLSASLITAHTLGAVATLPLVATAAVHWFGAGP
jgi:malonate transporter